MSLSKIKERQLRMEQLTNEQAMETLEKMNELAINPPADSEAVKQLELSPLEKVEGDIANFTSDILSIYRTDVETSNAINDKIQQRLQLEEKDGGFTNNQLIALQTNYNTVMNDKLSKTLGPIFTLMTEKQRNEYATKQAEAKQQAAVNINVGAGADANIRALNEGADSKVLQGMTGLNAFLNYFQRQAAAKSAEEVQKQE